MSDAFVLATVFLSGVTLATFAAAGLFFFRFWLASRDRFFLLFSVSCFLISIERFLALFIHASLDSLRTVQTEALAWVYLVRFFAFIAIAVAIWEKNQSDR
jgi:hypothetical protein